MTADLVPPPARQQLPSRWAAVTVADLLHSGVIRAHKDGNHGSNYPRAAEFGDNGIPFLTAKLLDDGHIDIDSAPRLPDERADGLRIGFVQPGDVLLSHNATIGRVAVVPMYTGRLLIGTSLTYFRLDKTRLIPNYLAAFFRGAYFQNQLKALMSHSTRNQVPITAQRHLQIMVPPVKEQLAIMSILDAFNDRINLLRQTNTTLEAIAQALFKSWFVDFDPVHAKAEGREPEAMDAATAALFPSEFDESELGPIPKGWRAGNLRDVAKLRGGKQLSRDLFIEDGQFPIFGGAGEMGRTNVFNAGGIVVTVGRVGAYCGQFFWHNGQAWVNNNASHIIPHPEYVASTSWIFLALKNSDIDRIKKGAAQPFISNSDIERLPLVVPDRSCIDAFIRVVRAIFYKASEGLERAQCLTELRDTLLPRLISGKLRLPEAERFVEAMV